MPKKTVKAKDLKIGDLFFFNEVEYKVTFITSGRVLGDSGVMGSKTDLNKEADVNIKE